MNRAKPILDVGTTTNSSDIDAQHGRQLTFQGYTVLLANSDGTIREDTDLGLFDYDTRILSKYRLLIDGEPPQCDTSANVETDYWVGHLTISRPGGDPNGPRLPQDAVGIEMRRELDVATDAWVTNAGVPLYTGLFGRDSLTSAWQGALAGPEILRGTLARIAATQAMDDSAWHDREPGKMVHEMRRGPLSDLNILPRSAYYGTQTSSAMFVVALSEYWHWTGDTEMLERYRDAALRTFEWASRFGDRDGDGFLEYERRSRKGLKNHGWKDSDEAIRYPDGRLSREPDCHRRGAGLSLDCVAAHGGNPHGPGRRRRS